MEGNEISLYSVAKQLVENETPIDPIQFNREMISVAEKIYLGSDQYYFLICPDLRQYVMFHVNDYSTVESIQKEISETLLNRGTILLIDKDNEDKKIWEFWIKDVFDNQNYMYQLTPYEVVEV